MTVPLAGSQIDFRACISITLEEFRRETGTSPDVHGEWLVFRL